jgi:sulfite exporter TauE/SafE
MIGKLEALLGLAAFVGFFHTLIGPDHYVPFVALARAGRWPIRKTLLITLLCGIGHVAGSILLGTIGIGIGLTLERLESTEAARADWTSSMLLAFGLVYLVWGLRRAWRRKSHSHVHAHEDGMVHAHAHDHQGDHVHVHPSPENSQTLTPWVLFVIFAFGPCEPLIPILIFPAATMDSTAVVMVCLVFAAATLATMMAMVTLGLWGLERFKFAIAERFAHAAAGLAITLCGLAMKWGF